MPIEKARLIDNAERGYGSTPETLQIDPVPGTSGSTTNPPRRPPRGGSHGTSNVVKYGKGEKWPQYFAALTSTLGAFALGTVLGWISPAISRLTSAYGFPVGNVEISWLGSLTFLGAAVVLAPIEYVIKQFGRKNTMLLLLIPFTIGWLFIIFASTITAIYIGRFVTGFASGAFCVTTPIYIAEIAQKEIRGSLNTMFPIMITAGILFAYIIGSMVTIISLSVICATIPLIFGALFYFQPESPVYLIQNNRIDEARQSLIRLRGRNFDVDSEIREIVAAEEELSQNAKTLTEAIKEPGTQRAFLIACGMMIFQQLTGLYPIMSYSTIVIQTGGASMITPGEIIIFLGVIQMLGNLIGEAIVDSSGRKYLLTRSAIYTSISLFVLGIFFQIKYYQAIYLIVGQSAFLPLLLVSIYAIAYSIGLGTVPWVLIGEVFAPEIKNKAASIAILCNLLVTFITSEYFLKMISLLGRSGTFYLFGFFCALSAVFTHFVVIETKGKSLGEIQRELTQAATS
ncbi:facilitated trehalose transporter Tret1-like [Chrysoperla carnea]|uniref:facilitated trehalose transporter Tret1-like n=1 Tax=Chrysoperla carnea TaxID=189513 RepID=UPI001D06550C|nr:facilitated trehalose transporter Tret1-like [Chrysoperla carnea]XP_044734841.1 facilitated trehalose transporter Tret1-like [Chrysoperla carnea]